MSYIKLRSKYIGKVLDYYIRKVVRSKRATIIIVTGSMGKTTTRYAISEILSSHFRVFTDYSNTNAGNPLKASFFGISLPYHTKTWKEWLAIISEVRSKAKDYPYDIVVMEAAESRFKKLKSFVDMLTPELVVVTAVAPAHIEKMGSMQAIVDGTWSLAAPAKTILYNADFPELAEKAAQSDVECIPYGFTDTAMNASFSRGKNGTLRFEWDDTNIHKFAETNHIASQGLYSLMAGVKVAKLLDMPISKVVNSIAKIKPVPGRMQYLKGVKGIRIIDDTYNANPEAVIGALKTLAEFEGPRIFVFGNINSVGEHAPKAYRKIAKLAFSFVDEIILFCPESAMYFTKYAKQYGYDLARLKTAHGSREAGLYLKSSIQGNETVLFKGSEGGIFTEEAIIPLLKAKPSTPDVLVRQDRRWLKKKQEHFDDLVYAPPPMTKKQIIGTMARLDFVDLNIKSVSAKIDTGADVSSLHVKHVREVKGRNKQRVLKFALIGNNDELIEIETLEFKSLKVRNTSGIQERRYKVPMMIRIGGREFKTNFTLANRAQMNFPILLGKDFLKNRFIVDVAEQGTPTYKGAVK